MFSNTSCVCLDRWHILISNRRRVLSSDVVALLAVTSTDKCRCSINQYELTRTNYYNFFSVLGAFAKLRKIIICFVTSLRLSVYPSAWNNSVPNGSEFRKLWYLSILRKSVKKLQTSLKPDKNNSYCTWRPMYICTFMLILMWVWPCIVVNMWK